MFKSAKVKYFKGTHRAVDPLSTIEDGEKKFKVAGITRVTDITHLDRIGIPVFSAIRPTAEDGAVSVYAGKGVGENQAKASAIMEGFERYSAERKEEDSSRIKIEDFKNNENQIEPESLILPKFTNYKKIEWIKSMNISDEKEVYIPANAVFHPYITKNSYLFRSNTNGLASGNILEESVLHGILEVIERDAWSLFESHRYSSMEVLTTEVENPLIQEVLNKFKTAEVDIKLLNLTADIPITTIAAVSDDTVLKDPALLTLGVGTHLNPEIAILRALTEVAQSRATQIHGAREDTSRAVFMRKAGYERMKKINRHYFGESENKQHISDLKDLSTNSFKEDIDICVNELKNNGFNQVLYTDLTREELEIPVVRVIIPGLEVFTLDPERKGKRILDIRKKLREEGKIR